MKSAYTIVYVWRQSRLGVSEGLNVLFADLVRGLTESNIPVRVLTTGRHLAGLIDVLEKNQANLDCIKIDVKISGNLLLRLRDWWLDRRRREKVSRLGFFYQVMRSIKASTEDLLVWLFDASAFGFLFKLPFVFVLALVALLFLPLAIVTVLFAVPLKRVLFRLALAVKRRVTPRFRSLFAFLLSANVWEKIYLGESRRFAQAVDKDAELDVLFIPTAFEGYICKSIKQKKKVIVFPDATPLLFPTRFPGGPFSNLLLMSMRDSVAHADGIVCYSDFVRDRQLLRFFGDVCGKKPIAVIPQGFFASDDFDEAGLGAEFSLGAYVKNYFPEYGPLPPVFFGQFSYIIYPTVDRPHKNTLTLLKAYELLLRQRSRNVKLILTSPGGERDTLAYIREHKLQRDVLFMPQLPISVLNHLLKHALVMVHPSFAEGGDIFNFSRAVSHGVPALLADIPVTREMFQRNGLSETEYGEWIFSPSDSVSLVDMIDRILLKEWVPLESQKRALDKLSCYRFSQMAIAYNDFVSKISSNLIR